MQGNLEWRVLLAWGNSLRYCHRQNSLQSWSSDCISQVLLTNCPKSKGFTLFVDLVFPWIERIRFFFYISGQLFAYWAEKFVHSLRNLFFMNNVIAPIIFQTFNIGCFWMLLRSWLIVFQDSFMLPFCIFIFSEKYCLLSVRLRHNHVLWAVVLWSHVPHLWNLWPPAGHCLVLCAMILKACIVAVFFSISAAW